MQGKGCAMSKVQKGKSFPSFGQLPRKMGLEPQEMAELLLLARPRWENNGLVTYYPRVGGLYDGVEGWCAHVCVCMYEGGTLLAAASKVQVVFLARAEGAWSSEMAISQGRIRRFSPSLASILFFCQLSHKHYRQA